MVGVDQAGEEVQWSGAKPEEEELMSAKSTGCGQQKSFDLL